MRKKKYLSTNTQGGLELQKVAISSNYKRKWQWTPHKTLKSLLEATRMVVTPKIACCRVLTTVGRFLNQSPMSPLYGRHHQHHFAKDQENLNTDFFKIIFKMKDFLVQGNPEVVQEAPKVIPTSNSLKQTASMGSILKIGWHVKNYIRYFHDF